MVLDIHAILLLILTGIGAVVGWLVLRAIGGVDEKIDDLTDDVRDLGQGQAHHGERLVRLETRAGLEPLPRSAPPQRERKPRGS